MIMSFAMHSSQDYHTPLPAFIPIHSAVLRLPEASGCGEHLAEGKAQGPRILRSKEGAVNPGVVHEKNLQKDTPISLFE